MLLLLESTSFYEDVDSKFCNCNGSLRVCFVRKHYGLFTELVKSYIDKNKMLKVINTKKQKRKLTTQDINEITQLYTTWRDTVELLPMRLTFKEEKIVYAPDLNSTGKIYSEFLDKHGVKSTYYKDYVFIDSTRTQWEYQKTCKRGNDVYIYLVKQKLKPLTLKEPIEYFSTELNNNRKRTRRTNLLYLTGTINFKDEEGNIKLNIADAWLNFGEYWNSFITNIRNQFKGCEYIRAWQSQKNGYPHFHAIVYIPFDFSVVFWPEDNSWRISTRQKLHKGDKSTVRKRIKNAWKWGNLDVKCLDSTTNAFKDLLKYVTRDLEGGESDLTNAMVWYFGKQSYSVSKKFIQSIWGENKDIDLAQPSNDDLISTISNNSNSDLLSIEVFPIIPHDILDFSMQTKLIDHANLPGPPPKVIEFFENLAFSCTPSKTITKENGVEIIIYKLRG